MYSPLSEVTLISACKLLCSLHVWFWKSVMNLLLWPIFLFNYSLSGTEHRFWKVHWCLSAKIYIRYSKSNAVLHHLYLLMLHITLMKGRHVNNPLFYCEKQFFKNFFFVSSFFCRCLSSLPQESVCARYQSRHHFIPAVTVMLYNSVNKASFDITTKTVDQEIICVLFSL